tara:strand:+ start:1030 stop:1971 length:942 start_codon:yes stop_codon:yes gene_type:complete
MSVYTKISKDALTEHLKNYSVGEFVSVDGISDGIENTNYLLHTSSGEYIFTIFENITGEQTREYLKFMNYLQSREFRCAHVELTVNSDLLVLIKDKPSAIIQKLSGRSITDTNTNYCNQVGKLLADFHLKSQSYSATLRNTRGLSWREKTGDKLKNVVEVHQTGLIESALNLEREMQIHDIPAGKIHADLFRDNVLFLEGKVSGMIDFYYSCEGPLIYDMAVVVNDWCVRSDGKVDAEKFKSFIAGYESLRPLNQDEKKLFSYALVSASLRFFLSRLHDLHFPKIGEMTHIKDPDVFEKILTDRLNNVKEEIF